MQKYAICVKKFEDKYARDKKHHKARNYYHYAGEYRGAAWRKYNLKQSIFKGITKHFTMGLTMIIILS